MAETVTDAALFSDNTQENSRKLFVGGLSWETSSDNLRAYMSRFGEVVDCSVKMDVSTGRSRGFGFVMFKTCEEADNVLKLKPHMLDGKIIDPKKAVGVTKTGIPVTKKIFVGGVRSETTDDALREYFSQYGTVHSLDFPIDHATNKRRGFCFIEFDEPDAAEKAMSMNFHPIGNQTVEVKPAYTKEQQQALMVRGMWPPQSLTNSGQILDGMQTQQLDFNTQKALNALLGQTDQNANQDQNGAASQYGQMAAAALLYQTYIQYAMALSTASLAQTTQMAPTPAQNEDQLSMEDKNKVFLNQSPGDTNPFATDQRKDVTSTVKGYTDKRTSQSPKSRLPRHSKYRSPRRSRDERRQRRRSSSENYNHRMRRRRSGSRSYKR